MLHFAYGSNMDRGVMRRHAPAAEAIGVASLANYRFVITADGYASVAPARGRAAFGVLWRLTSRDRITLDLWEDVARGLYRAETLGVQQPSCRRQALVYVARPCRAGRPKASYVELVVAAACAWQLPQTYIASLQQWLPAHPLGAGGRKLKEVRWM